jgi:ADP-heptose:LPS heptosyltransferase
MNTLVVRFRGIGDVLLSWFALEALHQDPDNTITYCTSSLAAPLFPPNWVSVVTYDWEHHPLSIRPNLPKAVLDIPHDRLVNMVNCVDWLDSTMQYRDVPRAHQFARLMGVEAVETVRPVWVDPKAKAAAHSYLCLMDRPIIVCQIDATASTRLWPYWADLSKMLMHKGLTVVWLGNKLQDAPDGVLNWAGITRVREWVALLAEADIIISTCTAATHIGARIPTAKVVALYGSTDYRLFTHAYQNVKPVTSYSLPCAPCEDWQLSTLCHGQANAPWCLSSLSPHKVARAVFELI